MSSTNIGFRQCYDVVHRTGKFDEQLSPLEHHANKADLANQGGCTKAKVQDALRPLCHFLKLYNRAINNAKENMDRARGTGTWRSFELVSALRDLLFDLHRACGMADQIQDDASADYLVGECETWTEVLKARHNARGKCSKGLSLAQRVFFQLRPCGYVLNAGIVEDRSNVADDNIASLRLMKTMQSEISQMRVLKNVLLDNVNAIRRDLFAVAEAFKENRLAVQNRLEPENEPENVDIFCGMIEQTTSELTCLGFDDVSREFYDLKMSIWTENRYKAEIFPLGVEESLKVLRDQLSSGKSVECRVSFLKKCLDEIDSFPPSNEFILRGL